MSWRQLGVRRGCRYADQADQKLYGEVAHEIPLLLPVISIAGVSLTGVLRQVAVHDS